MIPPFAMVRVEMPAAANEQCRLAYDGLSEVQLWGEMWEIAKSSL